jgi:hypothetical protein
MARFTARLSVNRARAHPQRTLPFPDGWPQPPPADVTGLGGAQVPLQGTQGQRCRHNASANNKCRRSKQSAAWSCCLSSVFKLQSSAAGDSTVRSLGHGTTKGKERQQRLGHQLAVLTYKGLGYPSRVPDKKTSL